MGAYENQMSEIKGTLYYELRCLRFEIDDMNHDLEELKYRLQTALGMEEALLKEIDQYEADKKLTSSYLSASSYEPSSDES